MWHRAGLVVALKFGFALTNRRRMGGSPSFRRAAAAAKPYPLPSLEPCHDVVAVHPGDEVDGDLLRAYRFALPEEGAAAEQGVHHFHHAHDAVVALGLALGEESEVRDLRRGEQLRGAVRTLRHAC